MKSKKRTIVTAVLASLMMLFSLVVWMSKTAQPLQAEDNQSKITQKAASGTAVRSIDLYLKTYQSNAVINGIKINIEAKKGDDWEKVTGSDGQVKEFVTKDGGRVQLVETVLREIENKYGEGPYRFYQASQPPGNYAPSIGKVSSEFKITATNYQQTINMFDLLIGTYTMNIKNGNTGVPMSGIKLALQINKNGGWHTLGQEEDYPAIDGIPTEFISNGFGQVGFSTNELAKLLDNYKPNPKKYRFIVTQVPSGYFIPAPKATQEFTVSETVAVTPTIGSIEVFMNREVVFQKTDLETGAPLAGIAFELQQRNNANGIFAKIDEDEFNLPSLVTDQNGQIKLDETVLSALRAKFNADAVQYRFKEVQAPVGYFPANDETASTPFSITMTAVTPKKVTLTNQKLANEMTLDLRNSMTGEPVSGATFVVQKQTGEDIWEDTSVTSSTNQDGQVILKNTVLASLGNGTYRFRETAAPAGYEAPTEKSVSPSFDISDGQYLVKSFVRMVNEPLTHGDVYLKFMSTSHEYKYKPDLRSGKGYVTELEAAQGWIRSNDELTSTYTINTLMGATKYKNLKIRVTAEVLDKQGYSNYAADPTKAPLQNVEFDIQTPTTGLVTSKKYDPETKTVLASQEFLLPVIGGSFTSFSITAKVGSTFFGTELPMSYRLELVSAVANGSGEEVVFNEGANKDLYVYDLMLPFRDNTLKVTSKLNMLPTIRGRANSVNTGISKAAFSAVTGSTDYPNSMIADIGYGWYTTPLETRAANSNLGLAVPRGNNIFTITLNQSIKATMSNGDILPLILGEGGDGHLPKIELFSYGAVGQPFGAPVGLYSGKYAGYNQTLLPRTYNQFLKASSTDSYGYQVTQDQQTGNITAQAKAPTYFNGTNGFVSNTVLFGVGNYLVYPAEPVTIDVTRSTRDLISAVSQDYTIGLGGASYEDNDGELIDFDATPSTNSTWQQTWPKPPVTPEPLDYSLTMEKKGNEPKNSFITGGKFVLEYKNGSAWEEVTVAGFTNLSADDNGQIVFTKQQLEELVDKVGTGEYRFRETEAPDGYLDPEAYKNKATLNSGVFKLYPDTINPNRVSITNEKIVESPNPGTLEKNGFNDQGVLIPLEGAVFELYLGTKTTENPQNDGDYTWDKVDVQSIFGLSEEEAKLKFKSNSSGKVEITESDRQKIVSALGSGRYRFKETTPPANYVLPEGDKAFSDSFYMTEDYMFPKDIVMRNERKAEWKDVSANKIGSEYGYSIEKDHTPMFAKLDDNPANPSTAAQLQARAQTFSELAGNFGVALQGEEIVVGSYQEAQYYSYATDNPNFFNNWQPKQAEMIQLWNPEEGELLGASYDYFEKMSEVGTTSPIQYGVKKNDDYTNEALDTAQKQDYEWYDTMGSVPKGQKISAVYGKITNFKKDYTGDDTHGQKIPTRWNLYTKRKATGNPGNGPDGKTPSPSKTGSYYTTYTRAQITYAKSKDSDAEEATLSWENTPYKPTGYKVDMGRIAPDPATSFADTLAIIPYYKPIITKQALNPLTGTLQAGNKYRLDNMMEYSLKATFPAPRPGTTTMPFKFTIRDYTNYSGQPLNNFSYLKDTSYLNQDREKNPETVTDGAHRYLEWKDIAGSYDVTNVYDLHFRAVPRDVGKFVNRADLVDDFYGTASATINMEIIEAGSAGGIRKMTSAPVIEKAGDSNETESINYTINIDNYLESKVLKNVKILDILPFSGDELGSDFQGGYALNEINIKSRDGNSLMDDDDTAIYYSTEKLPEDLDPNKAFGYSGANWKDYKNIPDADKKQVKAIYVTLPDLPAGETYAMDMDLLPFGNEAGDRYCNGAKFGFYTTDSNNNPFEGAVRTDPNTETVVISRTIEGDVWQDLNYSGIMEENDPRINNVSVHLYQMSLSGVLTKIAETTTDKEGHYSFDTVPSGYFKVGFKLPETYKDYIVTKLNVAGGDPLLTNKVSQTLQTEDGYRLTADPIHLPFYEMETDENGKETGRIKPVIESKGWNMGILPEPEMSVFKEVQKKNEQDQYVDIYDRRVNIGDELRYVITVTNEVEKSFLEDITIQDSLPRGLEYIADSLYLAKDDPAEDELLASSRYTFAPNQNGVWELRTQPLGNFNETTKEIKIYFNVRVTSSAKGKLTNVATAMGTLPPELNLKESDEVYNHVLPDPSIVKSHSWPGMDEGVPLKKGQEFTYTLTVQNAKGASSWDNVILTDTLNELMGDPDNPEDYLVYVSGSTKIDDEEIADADSWKDRNQLKINLGNFTGSADGTTKVIQFKVRLHQIPPKDPDGKVYVRNQATAVGLGTDENDEEKEYPVSGSDEFPLDKLLNKAKLHVRQVVLDANEELVIPSSGYLSMTQWDETNRILNGSTSGLNINSIEQAKWEDKTTIEEIKDSFTTFSLAILPDQEETQFDLVVPEYYDYLGDGCTTELTSSNLTTHTKDPKDPTVLRLPLKDEDEYWITLFITPSEKGKNPRPYSWDYAVNDFGTLKNWVNRVRISQN